MQNLKNRKLAFSASELSTTAGMSSSTVTIYLPFMTFLSWSELISSLRTQSPSTLLHQCLTRVRPRAPKSHIESHHFHAIHRKCRPSVNIITANPCVAPDLRALRPLRHKGPITLGRTVPPRTRLCHRRLNLPIRRPISPDARPPCVVRCHGLTPECEIIPTTPFEVVLLYLHTLTFAPLTRRRCHGMRPLATAQWRLAGGPIPAHKPGTRYFGFFFFTFIFVALYFCYHCIFFQAVFFLNGRLAVLLNRPAHLSFQKQNIHYGEKFIHRCRR